MGYHHLALAAKDINAIHHFYEEVMGFELVKVEVQPVREGGWAKHFFYRMENDSRFIAFWEMHDIPGVSDDFETNLSAAAGLPDQINHFSFDVKDMDDLQARKAKWLEAGLDVLEVDHNWCYSIYTKDPNDNLVEFCCTTGSFTAEDREFALQQLSAKEPAFTKAPPKIEVHRAAGAGGKRAAS